tara:strand:- start:758 stop:1027 length:270 start_codon:yes stop_codon:yes gene_type:complete
MLSLDNAIMELLKFLWILLAVPLGIIWKKLEMLQKKTSDTQLNVAQNYVTKSEYRDDIKSLHLKMDAFFTKQESCFERVFDKLDSKADK